METVIDSSGRYLLCNYSITEEMVKKIKTDVVSFMVEREKNDAYYEFINWQRQKNEIVVVTMHAYEDFLLPRKYNTVFEIANPRNFVNCSFTITQAILNGWTPMDQISKGHKHICIIQFDKEINTIFNSLSTFTTKETNQNNIQLGFCDLTDLEAIKINSKGA